MYSVLNSNRASSWDIPEHFTNVCRTMTPMREVGSDGNPLDSKVMERFGKFEGGKEGKLYKSLLRDFGLSAGKYKVTFYGDGEVCVSAYSHTEKYTNWTGSEQFGEFEISEGEDSSGISLWFRGKSISRVIVCKAEHFDNEVNSVYGKEWKEEYIEFHKSLPHDGIRTMNLQSINSNRSTGVESSPDQSSTIWGSAGVPIQSLCSLASETGKYLHLCIPTRYNEYSIRQMARQVAEFYPTNFKLDLEFSNELWNSGSAFNNNKCWTMNGEEEKYPATVNAEGFLEGLDMEIVGGQSVYIFDSEEQYLHDLTYPEKVDWRFNSGITGKLSMVEGRAVILGNDGKVLKPSHSEQSIILVVEGSLDPSVSIRRCSNAVNTFVDELGEMGRIDIDVNRIYATQNSYPALSKHGYLSCPSDDLPIFDMVQTAPYFETSMIHGRIRCKLRDDLPKRFEAKLEVWSSVPDVDLIIGTKVSDNSRKLDFPHSNNNYNIYSQEFTGGNSYMTLIDINILDTVENYDIYLSTMGDNSPSVIVRLNTLKAYNSLLNSPNGEIAISIGETFTRRKERSKFEMSESIDFFKDHIENVKGLGWKIGTYEGGTHDRWNMPQDAREYLAEYYKSESCEISMWKWWDMLRSVGCETLGYYKEGSRHRFGNNHYMCIFGLTSNLEKPESDGRFRWFSGINVEGKDWKM